MGGGMGKIYPNPHANAGIHANATPPASRILDIEALLLYRILRQLSAVDLARLECVHSRFYVRDASHPQQLSIVEEVARDQSIELMQALYPGTQLAEMADKRLRSHNAPMRKQQKVHPAADSWQSLRPCSTAGLDHQLHRWCGVLRYLERRQLAMRWHGQMAVGGNHNREAVLLVRDGALLGCWDPADNRTAEILPDSVRGTDVPGIGVCQGVGRVEKVSAGLWDVLAISQSGELVSWGRNDEGQGGRLDQERSTEPQVAEALEGCQVAAAEVAGRHSIALSREGEVFCSGHNSAGQLGRSSSQVARVAEGDTPHGPVRTPVSLPAKIRQVSCGLGHSSAVTVDGQLFTWGALEGYISHQPRKVGGVLDSHFVVHAVGGYGHISALTAGGCIVGVGWNYDGQLGLDYPSLSQAGQYCGVWPPVEVPVKARSNACKDGTCVTGGAQRVVDVAAGSMVTAVVTEEGHVLVTRRDKMGWDCLGQGFVAVVCGWGKGIVGVTENGSLHALAGLENVPMPSTSTKATPSSS